MKPLQILLLSAFLFTLSDCKDREITNPFDSACPKEIFTPSDFKAEQKGAAIQLSWKQENTNISGFVINRNENDGAMTEVAKIDKSFTQWSDENTTADKKYGYQLFAYAGENLSNMLAAYCTPVNKTVVVTDAVSAITSTSAVFGGSATNDSGLSISGRGVCYSANVNPTTADNKVEMGTGSGTFSLSITGLKAGITYYARAYAITKQGTTYGSQVTFTTSFLTVSPGSYTVPKESGSRVITVDSNIDWQVVSNQSWCSLSASSGKANASVTITITENKEVPQRTATLTFTGTGVASQSVTITQAGTEPPILTITPANQNVTNTAGSTTFTITSNVSWIATSDQSWCTITNTSGTGNATLTVNYEANTTNAQRVATLSITGLGLSAKTVTITQLPPIPTDGLVAYYPFNGNANDESGNGNNGIVNGATLTTDRKGIGDRAYYFDGTGKYIRIPQINWPAFGTGDFTACAWVNISSFDDFRMIFADNTLNNFQFNISSGGGSFEFYLPGAGYSSVAYKFIKSNWYCLIAMKQAGVLKFYINGQQFGSYNNSSAILKSSFLDIGYRTSNNKHPFYGTIDQVRIYNRALTEAEIQQLYNE